MTKRRSAAYYEEKAKIAREREAYKRSNPTDRSKTYVAKDTDYINAYYRDPLSIGRYLEIPVLESNLSIFGSGTDAAFAKLGLLTTAQFAALSGSPVAVPLPLKGNKIPIIKLVTVYGDSTPIVVPKTQGHGRYVKFYDPKNGKSHRSVPFIGVAASEGFTAAKVNMSTILAAYSAIFDTQSEKNAIVGENGTAKLVLGYGQQYTVLVETRR